MQQTWWYNALLGAIAATCAIGIWELIRWGFSTKSEPIQPDHGIRVRVLTHDGEPLLDADCRELYYIVKYGGMAIDLKESWPMHAGLRVLIGVDQNLEYGDS